MPAAALRIVRAAPAVNADVSACALQSTLDPDFSSAHSHAMFHAVASSSVAGPSSNEPAPQRGIPVAPARVARTDPVASAVRSSKPSSRYGAFSQIYDQWSGSNPALFSTCPKEADGRVDVTAKWGPLGDEYWEFKVKAAACRVRVAAFTAEPGKHPTLSEDQQHTLLRAVFDKECASRFADADLLFDCVDRRASRIIAELKSRTTPPDRIIHDVTRSGKCPGARKLLEDLEWDRQLAGHAPGSKLSRDPGIPQARDVMATFNTMGLDTHVTDSGPPHYLQRTVYRE